jgi:hypothetical protein
MGVRARLRAVCVVANPRNSQAIALVCASQPIPSRIPHTFIRDHEHVLRPAHPTKNRPAQVGFFCELLALKNQCFLQLFALKVLFIQRK